MLQSKLTVPSIMLQSKLTDKKVFNVFASCKKNTCTVHIVLMCMGSICGILFVHQCCVNLLYVLTMLPGCFLVTSNPFCIPSWAADGVDDVWRSPVPWGEKRFRRRGARDGTQDEPPASPACGPALTPPVQSGSGSRTRTISRPGRALCWLGSFLMAWFWGLGLTLVSRLCDLYGWENGMPLRRRNSPASLNGN